VRRRRAPELKALIDRAGFVAGANDDFFRRKIGAAVVAVRRGGAIHAFDSINCAGRIAALARGGREQSWWRLREEQPCSPRS
jgi:multimeric flavodoxin WrbA